MKNTGKHRYTKKPVRTENEKTPKFRRYAAEILNPAAECRRNAGADYRGRQLLHNFRKKEYFFLHFVYHSFTNLKSDDIVLPRTAS